MTRTEIMNALSKIHNGSFFKLNYRSSVPVKAAYKKNGIEVVKTVYCVARTGVRYDNIASVIEKKSAKDYVEPAPRANNKEWIVDNKLYTNTNTNLDYLRLGSVTVNKAKVEYHAYDENGNEIEFNKDFAIDSYWNRGSEKPPVFDVKIANVLSIG